MQPNMNVTTVAQKPQNIGQILLLAQVPQQFYET